MCWLSNSEHESNYNHRVCGLCPSSGILNKDKTKWFGKRTCFRPPVKGGGGDNVFVPLERANFRHRNFRVRLEATLRQY
jgi:hypothetical protein